MFYSVTDLGQARVGNFAVAYYFTTTTKCKDSIAEVIVEKLLAWKIAERTKHLSLFFAAPLGTASTYTDDNPALW